MTPGEAVTPARALAQIATYPPEAISLYWSFFVLDDVGPVLAFGTFALLWARLLHARPGRLRRIVLGTAVLRATFLITAVVVVGAVLARRRASRAVTA